MCETLAKSLYTHIKLYLKHSESDDYSEATEQCYISKIIYYKHYTSLWTSEYLQNYDADYKHYIYNLFVMLHEKYEDLDFIADIFITYQFPMAFITSITLSILFYLDIATIMKYSDADRKILYNTIDIIDNYILLYPIVHNKIDMFASLLYDGC